MDAREQMALAPFGGAGGDGLRRVASLQDAAFGLQREQGCVDLGGGDVQGRGEGIARGRAERTPGARARSRAAPRRARRRSSAVPSGASIAGAAAASRMQRPCLHEPLGGDPEAERRAGGAFEQRQAGRPSGVGKLGEPAAPAGTRPSPRRRRRRRARTAPRASRRRCAAAATPLRGRRRSPRGRGGRGRRRCPDRRSGDSARPACAAPRSARRRERRTAARSAPRPPAVTASAGRARPPRPRRLRCGAGGRASRRRPSPRAGSRRGSGRRAGAPGCRARQPGSRRTRPGRGRPRRADPPTSSAAAAVRPSGRRRSAAGRAPWSRSSASARRRGARRAAPGRGPRARSPSAGTGRPRRAAKLWLVDSESDDRVLGRRRLELDVEAAAEALAQGQPPGAVEAAAERGMDDQLHAARFVEETLEDDALLGRHARRARRALRPRWSTIWRAASSSMPVAVASRPTPPPRRRRRSGRRPPRAGARRRAESSSLRPGASPSQNGMFGAAPCASSTRTRPGSMRRMR